MSLPTRGETRSPWREPEGSGLAPLVGDRHADVAVVGAGITGLTTALLLSQRGWSVVVLEADEPGSGETTRSTAHLTQVLDRRYFSLIEQVGREAAAVAAHAHGAAIDWIESTARALGIECGFARVPGHLYCEPGDDQGARELEREV